MDPRVELSLINKHVRQHNREAMGEPVIWFEFLSLGGGGSVYDDIYDEGAPGTAGRVYAGGIVIPTVYISENEDEFVLKDEGRQVIQNIRLTLLFQDVERAGMTDPAEFQRHLNDVFFYDGRYYKVTDYVVWGRLPTEVVIGVSGFEIFPDQEFVYDIGPPPPIQSNLPWPPTFPPVVV